MLKLKPTCLKNSQLFKKDLSEQLIKDDGKKNKMYKVFIYFFTVQYAWHIQIMGKKAFTVHLTGAGNNKKSSQSLPKKILYICCLVKFLVNNVKLGSDRVASCESSISRSLFISFLSKSQTATTEISWALHAVQHNYLANLCDKVVQLQNVS